MISRLWLRATAAGAFAGAFALGAAAAALTAGPAADPQPSTAIPTTTGVTLDTNPTTTDTTTVDTTSASTTTTVESTTDAVTVTTGTPTTTASTATATTQPATTTQPTTTRSTTTAVVPVARPDSAPCLSVGGVVLLRPGRPPLLIGPAVGVHGARTAGLGAFSYPADGSIVTASSISIRLGSCASATPAGGSVVVESLSLLDRVVTARSVDLRLHAGKNGNDGEITGLTIAGKPVAARPGRRVPIGKWGTLQLLGQPRPVPGGGRSFTASALALHVLEAHGGLAAGTVLLVSFAATPLPAAQTAPLSAGVRTGSPAGKRRKHPTVPQPLGVTPPLGLSRHVFPVVGRSDYIDTYGGPRGDVPGNWHHGDDIFAALGTPVVAVASGTINRVGWEKLGGWRLWVRDSLGNQFYYAHLAGYAPQVLHAKRVTAGEVIGFVGNTGDAFTTSPHLHFEVHPRSLLHLHYNGAVDPTSYLDHWSRLERVRAPRPAHPALPAGAMKRAEAKFVWRELLVARGLTTARSSRAEPPKTTTSTLPSRRAAMLTPRLASGLTDGRPSSFPTALVAALVGLAGAVTAGGTAGLLRRRRTRRASTTDR